jgi:3-oxoadipate enol-lactonase/4-carboxymuconolactone decarboxylase
MAKTVRQGIALNWEVSGDPQGAPLLLLNSIGTDLHLWDRTLPLLAGFRVVRMDTRGHGLSGAPAGDYNLPTLADDAITVLDAAGIGRAAVAGVSLGGMIAMQMALDHPERISALIPICTSATMDRSAWAARVEAVRNGGTRAIAELAMARFLSPGFRDTHPEIAACVADGLLAMAGDGYAGCAAAIRDMDIHARLGTLAVPTLVIAGDRDTSTPFQGHGEHIVEAIGEAQIVHLHAAHLAPLEAPEALAAAMEDFLHHLPKRCPTTGTPSCDIQNNNRRG